MTEYIRKNIISLEELHGKHKYTQIIVRGKQLTLKFKNCGVLLEIFFICDLNVIAIKSCADYGSEAISTVNFTSVE